MLSKQQAEDSLYSIFPDRAIVFIKQQDTDYLFRAIEPEDSDESGYDDVYAVDSNSRQVREFSIFDIRLDN